MTDGVIHEIKSQLKTLCCFVSCILRIYRQETRHKTSSLQFVCIRLSLYKQICYWLPKLRHYRQIYDSDFLVM